MATGVMRELELPGLERVNRGKVREIFALPGPSPDKDQLLLVATDRLSAFDVILPDPIPHKGRVLTRMSLFWLERLTGVVDDHLITADVTEFPSSLQAFEQELEGRSMLVRKCRPLPIECVVRGYLAGSGWNDYQATGAVCGIGLPAGLLESAELQDPIFTPATKASEGHDENISFEQAAGIMGSDLAERVRSISIELYSRARAYARERGIIICDTKFEFGLDGEKLLLIDEVLTPDSSRFWPADQYEPGRSQPSFDKQFVRDYLEGLDWNKRPPGPDLPAGIVEATSERYLEAYRRLTGADLLSSGGAASSAR